MVGIGLGDGLQIRVGCAVGRPVPRTLRLAVAVARDRNAGPLAPPHILPRADAPGHHRALAEIGHHFPISAHGRVAVVLDVCHVAFDPRVASVHRPAAAAVYQRAVALLLVGIELVADRGVWRKALRFLLKHEPHAHILRSSRNLNHAVAPFDGLDARPHAADRRQRIVLHHVHVLTPPQSQTLDHASWRRVRRPSPARRASRPPNRASGFPP